MPYDDLTLEKKFSHCVSLDDPEIQHLSEATRRSIVDYAREKQRQQHVAPRDFEARVHELINVHLQEYTEIIASETFALVDKDIRKAISELRTELLGQINRAGDRVLAAAQKEIAAGVQRASNKLIIYDASDALAKKHIADDQDRIVHWNDVKKRA